MSYFGYHTFHAYWEATSKRGFCNERKTEEQAWQSVLKCLKRADPTRIAELIRDERRKNPNCRMDSIWYFEMPEARATIPADLLAEVDAVKVRIKL